MKTNVHFETFSIITKEEKVASLDHHIMSNTLVMEIITPLPGYYGAEYLINHDKPGDILIITKDYIHFEDFFRINNRIAKYLNFNFDSTFARVYVTNKEYFAIRIKDLNNFNELQELQKAFYDEGIKMERYHKINEMGIIRVKKFLNLEIKESGIIRDLDNKEIFYFEIDKPMSWKMLESITKRLRYNLPGIKFDAALGVLFRTGDLMDVIRIYGKNLGEEELNTIRRKYLEILKEYN